MFSWGQGNKPTLDKDSKKLLNCEYSKAYHRAKKQGKDKDACKKAGQEASKKMAATLENQS